MFVVPYGIDVVNPSLCISKQGGKPSLCNVFEIMFPGIIPTTTYHNPWFNLGSKSKVSPPGRKATITTYLVPHDVPQNRNTSIPIKQTYSNRSICSNTSKYTSKHYRQQVKTKVDKMLFLGHRLTHVYVIFTILWPQENHKTIRFVK